MIEVHQFDPLDAGMSARGRALATALERLLEEDLYWALVDSPIQRHAGARRPVDQAPCSARAN